jgi:arginyl-tRNA synthetase
MRLRQILSSHLAQAMASAGLPADADPAIAPSKNPAFGDYQANGAMAAAKRLGLNPRDLAQKIIDHLNLGEIATKLDVAGPGFINITLNPDWLAQQLQQQLTPQTPIPEKAQTIVVDYSGPNLAKEMHVGHLRSTIIGDAVVKALEFLGHTVIRQNHVGDWGTQFGMLIAELESHIKQGEQPEWALKDLEVFYQRAKNHFDADEDFANTARDYVVRLQSGDPAVLQLWQGFRDISLQHSSAIYTKLQVSLTAEHTRGESAYNADLQDLVAQLQAQGLAVSDEGAQVVFLQELADKKGQPSPVIVQKKDGGYLYTTTDLAALAYRANQLNADRILYFIDARQSLHLQQVFTLSKKAGWVPQSVLLEHHAFGTMMGEDGKPFKTRSGGTVKLADLLDEAIERAAATVAEKNPQLCASEQASIAQKVGIGAVKYADLSKTRTLDYIFSWDAMLSFEGNTGPYLQYAYTRIQSIFRRADLQPEQLQGAIQIIEPQEKQLAIKLLQFPDTLVLMGQEGMPHLLCNYLYELASLFMSFYEACPILKNDIAPHTQTSRLLLSAAVANYLKTGLSILGIDVMEKM